MKAKGLLEIKAKEGGNLRISILSDKKELSCIIWATNRNNECSLTELDLEETRQLVEFLQDQLKVYGFSNEG